MVGCKWQGMGCGISDKILNIGGNLVTPEEKSAAKKKNQGSSGDKSKNQDTIKNNLNFICAE
jgi:hypothetical protein